MQQQMEGAFNGTMARMNTRRAQEYRNQLNNIHSCAPNIDVATDCTLHCGECRRRVDYKNRIVSNVTEYTPQGKSITTYNDKQYALLGGHVSPDTMQLLQAYMTSNPDVYLVARELIPRLRFIQQQIVLAPDKSMGMVAWALKYPKMHPIPSENALEEWRNTV